jgi:hypothetical protein
LRLLQTMTDFRGRSADARRASHACNGASYFKLFIG